MNFYALEDKGSSSRSSSSSRLAAIESSINLYNKYCVFINNFIRGRRMNVERDFQEYARAADAVHYSLNKNLQWFSEVYEVLLIMFLQFAGEGFFILIRKRQTTTTYKL
uniref:Uncharacterized protein n=1 Tax=Glossina brevipalpis TaxID=37001 RepID=A0A1A9WB63_9MUSC